MLSSMQALKSYHQTMHSIANGDLDKKTDASRIPSSQIEMV